MKFVVGLSRSALLSHHNRKMLLQFPIVLRPAEAQRHQGRREDKAAEEYVPFLPVWTHTAWPAGHEHRQGYWPGKQKEYRKIVQNGDYVHFSESLSWHQNNDCSEAAKTEGSVRVVKSPSNVLEALSALKEMQGKLKEELGADGYMDYNLVICQANGRPIMTEHLNKRFKDILAEMNGPEIDPEEIVFHSLRHTSASAKLTLSNGDYNSVKQVGGWANLEMLTRRYGTHSFANDRERLNQKMDDFLEGKTEKDPALLMEIVKSIQSANKS